VPSGTAIAERLSALRGRIDAAARRANRISSDIQLIAVSKGFPPDAIKAAASAGHQVFGENRVQEALSKIDVLASSNLEWHLIGHLQSNKARKAAVAFSCVQSVDSLELVRKLDDAATQEGRRVRVLIQVDLAREPTKHGVPADSLEPLVDAALEARSLDLRGLMIVPPIPNRPEDSRPWFSRLRECRDALVARGRPADRLAELSMGMSGDFEVAIEEGTTMVRVGTAIFGARA
jgi:pyridoxal phosphate enzyme (YggS family)